MAGDTSRSHTFFPQQRAARLLAYHGGQACWEWVDAYVMVFGWWCSVWLFLKGVCVWNKVLCVNGSEVG
jgi:hypothetical protein